MSINLDLFMAVRAVLPFMERNRTMPIPERYRGGNREANDLRAQADWIEARDAAEAELKRAYEQAKEDMRNWKP